MSMGVMGGMYLALCAVMIWRSVAAIADGRRARNGTFGLRTRATRASDDAWLAAHRAAVAPARKLAMVCIAIAAPMMVAGVVERSVAVSPVVLALFVTGYAVLAAGAVHVVRVADRAARGIR